MRNIRLLAKLKKQWNTHERSGRAPLGDGCREHVSVPLLSEFRKKSNGFSIVEVVVVILIVAALTIALTPNFSTYTLKANRSDAVKSLMAMQIAQEKYRLTHATYAATATILGAPDISIDGHYSMAVALNTATATAYTLTATAIGEQAADNACTTFTLTYSNNVTTRTPVGCWQ